MEVLKQCQKWFEQNEIQKVTDDNKQPSSVRYDKSKM